MGVPDQVDARGRQVAQTDGLVDRLAVRRNSRGEDHEGYVHFLAIEASTVTEEPMFAQLFTVVRSDHNH